MNASKWLKLYHFIQFTHVNLKHETSRTRIRSKMFTSKMFIFKLTLITYKNWKIKTYEMFKTAFFKLTYCQVLKKFLTIDPSFLFSSEHFSGSSLSLR